MERGEGKMLNASCTASMSDADTVHQDGQEDRQHDSHLNGPIRESSEELSGAERTVKSGKKTRSARAKNNLRKSLAWDKAFSTDEGVLDIDELPLVTKTLRKPLELRLLDIPEILGKVSPSSLSIRKSTYKAGAAYSSERITYSPVQGTIRPKCLPSGETGRITSNPTPGPIRPECLPQDLPNSLTTEHASFKGSSPAVTPSNLEIKTRKSYSKASASVSGVTKQDVLKGTRLRLPSTFTDKRGKIDIPTKSVGVPQQHYLRRCKSSSSVLSPSSAGSALSNKVSSVSKTVKDTLGKALSGSFGGSARRSKVSERALHQGQGAKTSQTPLGRTLDAIGEDLNSPGLAAAAKPKITRRLLSRNSSDAIRKKDAQVETKIQDVNLTDQFLNGILVSSSKRSSTGKESGSSSKKGTENRSFYSTKLGPMFSRKKSGPVGLEVPLVDNPKYVNAARSSKGISSGLRLPSPKMGFFDKQTRLATGEHASNSLSERSLGAASDNSSWLTSRKARPPRPEHGVPCSRSARPSADSNLVTVTSQLSSSGIPSAPHLRPAKALGSAVSAPTSPLEYHHVMLSPGSHRKTVTDSGLASQRSSDHRKILTLRNDPQAFQNLMPESRDCDSDELLKLLGPWEVDAQPQVTEKSYGPSPTGHEAHVKFVSSGGDKSPNKLATLPVLRTRRPAEQPEWCTADSAPISGSPQSAGLMDKSGNGCRLPSMVEDIREANDGVFYTERASSICNCSDELLISSSVDPLDTVSHKFQPVHDSGRVGRAQSTNSPESERCAVGHPESVDISVGHPAQGKAFGSGGDHFEMVILEFERSLSPDSALNRDYDIEDSTKFSEGQSSVMDDISCCVVGELTFQESGEAIISCNEVLSTEDSRNLPGTSERRMMCSTNATEERVQGLSRRSPVRHLENADVTICKNNSLESPSHWSDWPILTPSNKPSSQSSSLTERTPALTPVSKRPPYTGRVAAENAQQNTPDSSAGSLSPSAGPDSRGAKNPLTMNVGLMNGVSWCTSRTPARNERNLQLAFDQSASDTTSGQENKRNSDGLIGSPHLHKPKQRKPNSSQKLDQPEAYGDLFSEERLRALEAAGAESLQKKTGAVQHSPRNKISPNRNPWSPVKRSGQQPLGPFDCTKKYSSSFTGK